MPRKQTTTEPPAPALSMRLVDVSPTTLVLGANVRLDANVGKDFVASIRERGVIEPIVAYVDADERLVVLHGQRRTVGAIQAKRDTVPVYLVPEPTDADRLVDQLGENDHRASLTVHERVGAYEQLAALGVTAAQIAKRTAAPRPQVDAALAVAGSDRARFAMVAAGQALTLEQAAIIAELGDDDQVVEELLTAADRGQFDHVAQRLRDDRAEARLKADAAQRYAADGIKVVDELDYRSNVRRLDGIKGLDETNHRDCPGHAVYLEVYEDDEAVDDEGYATGTPALVVEPVYVCLDAVEHGHVKAPKPGREAETVDPDQAREAAAAERRDVIQSNKAWDSAATVRRTWLVRYLERKQAPKTAPFLALALARGDYQVLGDLVALKGSRLAHDIFGVDRGDEGAGLVGLLEEASEPRAHVIALGIILCAYEESLGRDAWRYHHTRAGDYLRFLESQGYELAPIERRACGEKVEADE